MVIIIGFAFGMLMIAGSGEAEDVEGSNDAVMAARAMKNMQLRMAIPFSIVVTRFQLNLEFFKISIQWPPGLMSWLKWFDFALNLDFGVRPPSCLAVTSERLYSTVRAVIGRHNCGPRVCCGVR